MTAETSALGEGDRWWFVDGDEPWAAFAADVESRPESITPRDVRLARCEVEQGPD